jgi:hypothetical protein
MAKISANLPLGTDEGTARLKRPGATRLASAMIFISSPLIVSV